MSIILKGIDLPKDSKGIELIFIPKYGDIIYNESMSIGADRIIEIPTPHGKLIDADQITLECQWCSLDTAPTILEAEE